MEITFQFKEISRERRGEEEIIEMENGKKSVGGKKIIREKIRGEDIIE